MDLVHIPEPRQELTAEQMRQRIVAFAPSMLELRQRLAQDDD